MESLKLSLAGSKYTCHNLFFFVILFTISSGLCALMGSSSKSFPFLIPAIIFQVSAKSLSVKISRVFVQILNIIATSAAIGFSFLGDKYAFGKTKKRDYNEWSISDDNLPIFICSIACVVLCIIFFFVYLCSYNHLRSIARRREKY